jgi:DNA-binding transcriptional ArsR family regulator
MIGTKTKQLVLGFLSSNGSKEFSVKDIHESLNIPESSLSKNLDDLRNVGILDARKDGKYKYYSMNEKFVPVFRDSFSSLKKVTSRLNKKKVKGASLVLILSFFMISLSLTFTAVEAAGIPDTLNVQGKLTNTTTGTTITGLYNLTFRMYDQDSGGTSLWTESQELNTDNGVYDAILGLTVPLTLDFDTNYWMSLEVNSTGEMTPRINITSTPHTYRAGVSEDLVCTDCIGETEITDDYLLNDGDTATGNYTFDSSTFFIDSSYDRIGIGTTSPDQLLHLLAATIPRIFVEDSTNNVIAQMRADDSSANFGSYSNHDVRFVVNDDAKMAIETSGQVGIGLTDPQSTLTVKGDINATVNVTTPILCLNGDCQSSWPAGDSSAAWDISGTYVFNDTASVTVGIGTNTPATKLSISDTADQLGIIDSDGSQEWRLSANSNIFYIEDENSGAIPFKIEDGANTDTLIIDDSGNVGIGTTTPAMSLHIEANNLSDYTPLTTTNLVVEDTGSANYIEIASDDAQLTGILFSNESGWEGYVIYGNSAHANPGLRFGSRKDEVARFQLSGGFSFGDSYITTDPGENNMIIEGDVGIGTTDPVSLLNIYNSSSSNSVTRDLTIRHRGQGSTVGDGTGILFQVNPTAADLAAIDVVHNPSNDGEMRFYTRDGNDGLMQRLTIEGKGNVGINTTSPDENLEISGIMTGSAGSYTDWPTLRVTSETDSTYNVGDVHSELQFYTEDAGGDFPGIQAYIRAITTRGNGISNPDAGLVFGTSAGSGLVATDRMIIEESGHVGIGNTGPDTELHVQGGLCVDTDSSCSDPGDGSAYLQGNLTVVEHGAIGTNGALSTNTILDIDETLTNDANLFGMRLDTTCNPGTITANRYCRGLYILADYNDVDENGNHAYLYGANIGATLQAGSTANQVMGTYSTARAVHTTGTVDNMWGSYNLAYNDATGIVTTVRGTAALARNDAGTVTNAYGGEFSAYNNVAGGTIATARGVYSRVYETAGTVTTGTAFYANCDDAATCYGLYVEAGDAEVTTDWGIYVTGEDDNYLSNDLTIASLVSCDTIDTSAAGLMSCGTDDDNPEPADVNWADLTDDDTFELTTGLRLISYELRVCNGACGTQNQATGAGDLYVEDHLEVDNGITTTTLNTGYGANELYDMDQHVLKTSGVQFSFVNVGGAYGADAGEVVAGLSDAGAYSVQGASMYTSGDITIGNKVIHAGDTNTYFSFVTPDNINIFTSGSNRFTISSLGSIYAPKVYSDVAATRAVYATAAGLLGTQSSSIHRKENIRRDIDEYSSKIFDLEPLMFDYKDGNGDDQFGLIAEEVEPIMPELISYGYFAPNDTNLTNEFTPADMEDQYETDEETGEKVLVRKAKESVLRPVTVMYQKLPPLMLNELKKIKVDVDNLKALSGSSVPLDASRIDELEQKNAELELRIAQLEDMLKSEQGSVTVQLG